MINPILLSDSLAKQVASEVIYSMLIRATEAHLANEMVLGVSREIERAIAELKEEEYPHKELFEALFKALDPYEKKFKAMLYGIWEEERKIIVANIKKMRKAYLRKDAIDQILYPRGQFEKKLSAQAAEIILIILTERGAVEMGTIAAADVVFDVQNPEVQKWLKSYTPKFSAKLEEVNVVKLRAELIEGIKAGEGIPELIERVNGTYANWNKVRSESIAQNQVLRASNRANLEAYKQSGVVNKKIWITNYTARTCPHCLMMDGKTIGLKENFWDLGETSIVQVEEGKKLTTHTMKFDYEAIETPPAHNRCKCSIGPWMEE